MNLPSEADYGVWAILDAETSDGVKTMEVLLPVAAEDAETAEEFTQELIGDIKGVNHVEIQGNILNHEA